MHHSQKAEELQESHGPSAPSFSARLQAATALTDILTRHNIPHAFIGGFAFNLLGTSRSTLDIDVIIEDSAFPPCPRPTPDPSSHVQNIKTSTPTKTPEPAIHQIRQLLVDHDSRFSLVGAGLVPKLVFTAQTEGENNNNPVPAVRVPVRVPVETLRAGSLGLPRHLNQVRTVLLGIPILAPRFLLLTKIKRCTNFLGSDRPKSVERFKSDEGDIKYLLEWLVEEGERVDIEGYCRSCGGAGRPAVFDDNSLIRKIGELVWFWKGKGDEEKETVARLQRAMEEEDWKRVVAVGEQRQQEEDTAADQGEMLALL
ncbi:hypothetical protein B0T20DRAFT_389570 [Sordaria brevicollis]|uniref:Uncharacterized protein n=1 Tax=Sordaria brevicollis TaxID=83679 RepID=A0AAE0UEY3_SORBR|nr:hypothetical protein B0T20DRAFT_389570 [Sordaria brevicollis]